MLTVGDALAMEDFVGQGLDIIGGLSGLNRPVRWAHVTELPWISSLLQGGELLLTTGIAMPKADMALDRFVADLAEANAAGVVVQLGPRYERLPKAMVRAADRIGIPLVSLSVPTRFVQLTEAINSRLVHENMDRLRAVGEAQRRFTDLLLGGAGTEEILRDAAEMTDCSLVLETPNHAVVAHALGPQVELRDILFDWDSRSRRVAPSDGGVTRHEGADRWLLAPVKLPGGRARLVMTVPKLVTPRHEVVLEQAALALGLLYRNASSGESLEYRAQDNLLSRIITGSYSSAAEIYVRSASLGIPLRGHHLIALRIRARSLVTQDVILDRELVTNAVKASGMQCLSSSSAGHLDVLLVTPPRRTDSRAALERVTAAIHRAVSESTPLDVAITAGDPVADLADVAHSFWQARQVMLSVGQGRSTRELFSTYDDVDVQGLMRLLKDDRRVQEFVERRLGRIMQSPAGDRQQLLRTLAVYLEQGGNKSTTSELLKINRSTLYQRLRRLSKLLRCDLQSPVHRTALAVALAGLRAVREDFPGNDTV